MMHETIKNFASQFAYEPVVHNAEKLPRANGFIVAGMGGSHLAADLLTIWKPELDITVHSEYGFPADMKSEWLPQMLFIASSYSGNTEETLDSFQEALKRNMSSAAICVGGKLLEMAKEAKVPYVVLPDTGIQPRSALGFNMKALLALMHETAALNKIGELAHTLQPLAYEETGRELARKIKDHVPVIYASARNRAIAYNWKIKFNETGKIPAFYNIFPELNHNEMTGLDVAESTHRLSEGFYFILLKDGTDDPRIYQRMEILNRLYQDRGLLVIEVPLEAHINIFQKIFSSLVLADWTAYYTAETYGVEAEQVPMVEEFKQLMAAR